MTEADTLLIDHVSVLEEQKKELSALILPILRSTMNTNHPMVKEFVHFVLLVPGESTIADKQKHENSQSVQTAENYYL